MRLLAIALALVAPAANAALVTFDYRGAEYDHIATEQPTEDEFYEFSNPWQGRTQNYVTGWITIDTDLIPGGSLESAFVNEYWNDPDACPDAGCEIPPPILHAWSFFDGVNTNGHPAGENEFFNGATVQFSTDADGNLATWSIDFLGDPEALNITSR